MRPKMAIIVHILAYVKCIMHFIMQLGHRLTFAKHAIEFGLLSLTTLHLFIKTFRKHAEKTVMIFFFLILFRFSDENRLIRFLLLKTFHNNIRTHTGSP